MIGVIFHCRRKMFVGDSAPFSPGLDMFIPDDTSDFYKYNGSFTHPPCLEVITWTVFKHARTISQTQVLVFT